MSEEDGFTEKSWHWWMSRIVVPLVVMAVGFAGLLWVNRDNPDDPARASGPSDNAMCADDADDLDTGWGPDRPTVGPTGVSGQPSFNVERNNPNYGDERNFLRLKEASFTSAGEWTDVLDVVPGGEYLLQVYIHNGASAINSPENVASDTTVRFGLPTCDGLALALEAVVSSPAAYPQMVFDTAVLRADQAIKVHLVPGSVQLFNNSFPGGIELPDRVATGGGRVGSAMADGSVGGGFANSLYVSARVRTSTR
ncbi:hypothetical protein [Rhodococcus sp. KRD162]|uniref:hypothetical protein n=1 Tax=Rhodococcus sp. KRD162 TaxID=2729725 RepID=UPI0019D04F16|nr:hypothetical protein [Rhodococcus sp. KRD162]